MGLTVELRNQEMEAYALLGADATDSTVVAEEILTRLMALGVAKLPDIDSVARAVEAAPKPGELLVASGVAPKHGISAQLFPSFPIKDTPPPEDGSVFDAFWQNVTYPNEIVLRKTPATAGIPGATLLGRPVPASSGTEIVLTSGGGVSSDSEGSVYRSMTYGVVLCHRGTLSVTEALDLSEDRMEARITVLPDKMRDENVQLDSIVSALKVMDIVRGVDRDAILTAVRLARSIEKPVFDVLAAKGVPAVDAQEAQYRVLIDLEQKALKVLDGDKVDFREKDAVKNVHAGEVLAEVVQAAKPMPGYRVDGTIIPPKTIHVDTLKPGTGVIPNADGTKIVAETDGMIVVKARRFSVVSEYVVQGDVDIKTGNIRAAGLVKIFGTITAGFVVDAGRELTVTGDVWEGVVNCGESVRVMGAITAGSKVRAKGHVSARFIQDSFVENEGDVEAQLNITASEIYSKGKVRVTGSQGQIVGGLVNATLGIEARNIGSPTARTHVAVGLDLRVIAEMDEIRKQLPPLQEELQRLHSSLGKEFLKDPQAALLALPPVLRKNKLDVLKAMKDNQAKRTVLTTRQAELEEALKEQKEAVIVVHGEIHGGTEVSIGRVRTTVSETLRRVTILLDRENNCVTYRKG